jgi:hypothetical protein
MPRKPAVLELATGKGGRQRIWEAIFGRVELTCDGYKVTAAVERLPIGIEIDGKRRRAFELRVGVIGDSVAAVEALGGDNLSPNRLRYAVMARRLTLEGLKEGAVTVEQLMSLADRDGVALEAADAELEKKLDALSSS